MPRRSKNPDWIDWRNSKARGIILGDLEPGGMLVGMDHVSAEEVFDFYKKMPEFVGVVLSQFKIRLADHRKQLAEGREMAKRDAEAFRKDRLLYPRKDRNQRGELVFDLHPAKHLLRMDVENGVHEQLSPKELQKSRPAYQVFKYEIFKHRIYQEVRRKKFLRYLELKREKERPSQSALLVAHPLEEIFSRGG